ncbi:MAG TPA: alpha/beta hydrolase [Bacillales bacterium]|nr:alpha/beta hydrolase [Bacillales bacterium]
MNIDKINIYYETHACRKPSSDTVVLIHGYLSSVFSFRRIIPLLRETCSVVAIDLPGFGDSDKTKAFTYSLANYGNFIHKVLNRLNIEKAVLVGHSMGGQIALHAARQAPSRVHKLILLASSGYLKPFDKKMILLSYLPFFSVFVKRMFAKKNAEEVLHEVVNDPSIIDRLMIDRYVKPLQSRSFYKAMVGLLRQHGGDLTSQQLRDIQVPVQLLWGKQDRIVPLSIGEQLQNDLPNAKLHVINDSGHLLPEEKPEEVFRHLSAFLNQ